MKKPRLLTAALYLIVLVLLFSVITAIFGNHMDDLSYSQVIVLFQNEQVKSFTIEDNTIRLVLHQPYDGKTKLTCNLADPEGFMSQMQEVFAAQRASGVLEDYDILPEGELSPFDFILPLLIVGIVLLFLWFLVMGRLNTGGNPMANFGRARTTLGVPGG